jgi:hypothetical protein
MLKKMGEHPCSNSSAVWGARAVADRNARHRPGVLDLGLPVIADATWQLEVLASEVTYGRRSDGQEEVNGSALPISAPLRRRARTLCSHHWQ